jgi:hypothetical protein
MTVLARRRWAGVVTWSLTGFTVLVLVAALVLLGLDGSRMAASRIGLYCAGAAAVVVYAGVGHLIASRRPDNAIGWPTPGSYHAPRLVTRRSDRRSHSAPRVPAPLALGRAGRNGGQRDPGGVVLGLLAGGFPGRLSAAGLPQCCA